MVWATIIVKRIEIKYFGQKKLKCYIPYGRTEKRFREPAALFKTLRVKGKVHQFKDMCYFAESILWIMSAPSVYDRGQIHRDVAGDTTYQKFYN